MKRTQNFTVTAEHLALLRRANVYFQDSIEWGAPWIDPKRPYGNGNLIEDIHEILGGDLTGFDRDRNGDLPPDLRERYERLHRETATALQIALVTGEFSAGGYEASEYGTDWKPVDAQAGTP